MTAEDWTWEPGATLVVLREPTGPAVFWVDSSGIQQPFFRATTGHF